MSDDPHDPAGSHDRLDDSPGQDPSTQHGSDALEIPGSPPVDDAAEPVGAPASAEQTEGPAERAHPYRAGLRVWSSPLMQQFYLVVAGSFIACFLVIALILGVAADSIVGKITDRRGVDGPTVQYLELGTPEREANALLGTPSATETTYTRDGKRTCRFYHIDGHTVSDTWEVCFEGGRLVEKRLRTNERIE